MSKGKINTTGVDSNANPTKSYTLIPEGEYIGEIMDYKDKTTKNDDIMISYQAAIILGDQKGRYFFDNIIFPHVGSPAWGILGRTKHFLHCIGEPYEGDIEFDSDRWLGRKFRVVLFHDKYYNEKAKEEKTVVKVKEYILDETLANNVKADKETWDNEETP